MAFVTGVSGNNAVVRRILVGLIVAAVGLTLVARVWTFDALVLVLGVVMLYELNALCEIKGQPLEYQVAMVGVVAYIVLAMFDLLHKWEGVLLAGITIASFSIGMYGEQKGYFARTAYTLLAVLYIGKLLTYFIFLRSVPQLGIWWTYDVVVLIALTDIFAMVVGSLIGRHQLTKISPNKTVEGSVGALVIVAAVAAVGAMLVPQLHQSWWQGLALGVATSVAAQAGDLAESALKRDAGVKDTGAIIQGHGGVLDRFDSYLFGGMAYFGTLHLLGALAVPQ
ncbi:MAG TPA: phosphatidate cytidylyltransferase [Candidatus Acidoferrales bacterium]|nr:phosphatidate cytidylyltransferase [Candidatus Acidoferrales bacterium]